MHRGDKPFRSRRPPVRVVVVWRLLFARRSRSALCEPTSALIAPVDAGATRTRMLVVRGRFWIATVEQGVGGGSVCGYFLFSFVLRPHSARAASPPLLRRCAPALRPCGRVTRAARGVSARRALNRSSRLCLQPLTAPLWSRFVRRSTCAAPSFHRAPAGCARHERTRGTFAPQCSARCCFARVYLPPLFLF